MRRRFSRLVYGLKVERYMEKTKREYSDGLRDPIDEIK